MQDYHQIILIVYAIVILATIYHIIMDTEEPAKASAYLLLVIGFPIIGVITYYMVGVNYRKKKIYAKKLETQNDALDDVGAKLEDYNIQQLEGNTEKLGYFYPLANFLKEQLSVTSNNNNVKLLVNGDNKFPHLLEDLRNAKEHIHIQYYIYEDDDIGNEVGEILIEKAQQGLEVRFMYDDFGSNSIHKKFINRLKEGGVEVYPFYKIRLPIFMSRLNYRNHRKIVVIDGSTGYVGGINVSDKYINEGTHNEMYWRDTHIRLEGVSVMNLQFIFMTDWNFASKQNLEFLEKYFRYNEVNNSYGDKLVQACYSGPDSNVPTIMYSLIEGIILCRKEVLITNPYFIPSRAFIDALIIASQSGIDVKLLVPGISDSWSVNAICKSYYGELLREGIRIFRYQKGFVHAKTMVCDEQVSFVGTANLDERSFNLNFEVNATIYDKDFSKELKEQFYKDLEDSTEINYEEWQKRPKLEVFIDRVIRLLAPLF